ncbi:MAG: LCP family protein [Gudongella sp.]|jgi:LCP family protein required for cell wall assembly|nr:LCP family protein [Gudongella sp.]
MKKLFITVFIASLAVFALFYGLFGGKFVSNEPVSAETPGTDIEEPLVEEPPEKETNDIVFLMMGVDAKDVKKSKGTRTDTLMLTRVNLDTGKITLLSIPRDTRTDVRGKKDKINAAHAYGGSEAAVEAVKNLLDIDIEYYVKVDYQIVQDVVNAIGGVTIDVPFNMTYNDPTADPPLKINIKKGDQQTLDGKNAHDFLRWRHNNDMTVGYPDGDVGRTRAQQYFMKELIKQTVKPKNLLKLPSLVKATFDNVETNIPLKLMLKGAVAANKIDTENIETATIPGDGQYVGDISYFIHDAAATKELVKAMFGDYTAE